MKKKLSNEELITFCGQMALILKSGIFFRLRGFTLWKMEMSRQKAGRY